MSKISAGKAKIESSEEKWLREWFETQEQKAVDNMEAGARQIISLVSLFYGIIFGALSLGKDKLEASLHYRPTLVFGTIAILALLVAVIAALAVALPIYRYSYSPHKPAAQKAVFRKILKRKVWGLRVAIIAFGLGLAAFAGLVGTMLYYR